MALHHDLFETPLLFVAGQQSGNMVSFRVTSDGLEWTGLNETRAPNPITIAFGDQADD